MAPRKNLSRLALEDCTASERKWESETRKVDGIFVRQIRHYGTLMMEIMLDPADNMTPIAPKGGNPFACVLYERPGGSMSDKCGLSRIRQSLLRL